MVRAAPGQDDRLYGVIVEPRAEGLSPVSHNRASTSFWRQGRRELPFRESHADGGGRRKGSYYSGRKRPCGGRS